MKSGLDYTLFKLFHLSILWRASTAKLDEFSGVALGRHEESLREMLLVGSPGSAADYRLAASILLRPASREVHGGIIGVPARHRHDGHSVYSSVYGGCIWHCFVSRDMPVEMDLLQEDGRLCMTILDVRGIPHVWQSLARAATAGRKERSGRVGAEER